MANLFIIAFICILFEKHGDSKSLLSVEEYDRLEEVKHFKNTLNTAG